MQPSPGPGKSGRLREDVSRPLRGQLWIALNNGVTEEEIVELFSHVEADAGAARAFDSYQIAREVVATGGGRLYI